LIACLAFLIPLGLYLSFPSCFWNFDGVACAAALELGQPTYFFHANHLLYGFLGFLFWKGIGLPLGLTRALPALQLFTSLLSCLGLVGLYRLILPVLENRWSALLLTSTLSVTAAFWVWSIEAQVYALGFLALAWATYTLIQSQSQHKYWQVGLLHGAAVLGHLMHFLWALPALFWIATECRRLRISTGKPISQYLGSLAAATIIPYVLVVGFVIAPGRDLHRVAVWLKGSAGLTPDRHWAWHSGGWSGPWVWLKSTGPALWGSFWPYGNTIVAPWIWIATSISIILAAALFVRGWRERRNALYLFSALWLGVYGLFLSTWEAGTLCYRMTDILPLGILFALGLKTWRAPLQILIGSTLLASTMAVNLSTRILPMHQMEQNSAYQDTLTLSKITPSNSLYVADNSLSWLYILYFTGRTAWSVHSFDPMRLETEINREKHNRPVYIQKGSQWQPLP